jgi:hypothetical protein
MLFGTAVEAHDAPRGCWAGRQHEEAGIVHNDEPSPGACKPLHLLVGNRPHALKSNDLSYAGAQLPQVNPG